MVAALQANLGGESRGHQTIETGASTGLALPSPLWASFSLAPQFRASADEAPKSGIDRNSMLHYLSVGLLPLFGAGLRSPLAIKLALGLGCESSSALPMDTSLRVSA